MRPRAASLWHYEPPRLRDRRMRDVRDIATAYAAAVLGVALLIVGAYEWLWDADTLVAVLWALPLIAIYIAIGALLLSFAARRIATWDHMRIAPLPPIRWFTFLAWPLIAGVLLYRLVNPNAR